MLSLMYWQLPSRKEKRMHEVALKGKQADCSYQIGLERILFARPRVILRSQSWDRLGYLSRPYRHIQTWHMPCVHGGTRLLAS